MDPGYVSPLYGTYPLFPGLTPNKFRSTYVYPTSLGESRTSPG